jgi:GntR family transcriptional repressor for pyruvate dehydrogenase complex
MGYKEYFPGVTEKKNANEIFERIFKRTEKLNIKVLGNRRQITCKIPKKKLFLREAMRALASRNVITIRQGSGSYVSATPGMIDDPFGLTFVEDKQKMIKDLMEIRFLIEPSIAAMAAIRADETDIKNILTACENTEKLLLANKNHAEKDIAFHTAIALSSKNIVVPKLVPIINSSIPLIRESAKFTMRDETIEIHREIADAIAAHDAVRAHDAMYLHLIYNRKHIKSIN